MYVATVVSSKLSLTFGHPDPTPDLSLNCFLLGDKTLQTFTVKLLKSVRLDTLRDAIKAKKAPELDHVAASTLDLWSVSIPFDALPSKNNANIGSKLQRLEYKLSDLFPSELDPGHAHVIVGVPNPSECCSDSRIILLSILSRGYFAQVEASAICVYSAGSLNQPASYCPGDVLREAKSLCSFERWTA